MITVILPFGVSVEKKSEITEHLNHEITHNSDFSGCSFEVVSGDFLNVAGVDEYSGVILRNSIDDILSPVPADYFHEQPDFND